MNAQYQRRLEKAQWYFDMKATLCCEKCGEKHPACLEFHHPDPDQKEQSVSRMVMAGYAKSRILEEIAKCKVWCSNCHQKYHYMLRIEEGVSRVKIQPDDYCI